MRFSCFDLRVGFANLARCCDLSNYGVLVESDENPHTTSPPAHFVPGVSTLSLLTAG